MNNKKKQCKTILCVFTALTLFVGCTIPREEIKLTDNKGIFLSDGKSQTLPIRELEVINNESVLNNLYKENEQLPSEFMMLYDEYQKKNIPIHRYSLNNVHLLLNRNYEKPVFLQIVIGTDENSSQWYYEWKKDSEISFDIDNHISDKNPTAIYITAYKLDDEDIIVEYESYLFLIQKYEEKNI